MQVERYEIEESKRVREGTDEKMGLEDPSKGLLDLEGNAVSGLFVSGDIKNNTKGHWLETHLISAEEAPIIILNVPSSAIQLDSAVS